MIDSIKNLYRERILAIKNLLNKLDDTAVMESFNNIADGMCYAADVDIDKETRKMGMYFSEVVIEPEDSVVLLEQHFHFIKDAALLILNFNKESFDVKQEILLCLINVIGAIILNTAKIITGIYKQELHKISALQKITESISNQLKSVLDTQVNFIANISHDMKTPLHSIIGYLMVLKSDKSLPSEKVRIVENAIISAEMLLSLVNDVLDAAKVTVGEIELVEEPFWLSDVIRDTYEIFHPLVKEKGLEFKVRYSSVPYQIIADKRRIFQIIMNLVSNSLKFTDSGYIYLDARIERDHLIIDVEDTGRGIPEEEIEHIFKPFYQVEDNHAKRGSGLGLYIVRTLIRKMKGQIYVKSKVGEGTKITVKIKVKLHRPDFVDNLFGETFCIVCGSSVKNMLMNLKMQLESVGANVYLFSNLSQFFYSLFKDEISVKYLILVEPFENFIRACQIAAIVKNYDRNVKCLAVTEHCVRQCEENPIDVSLGRIPSVGDVQSFIMKSGQEGVKLEKLKVLVVDDEPFNREVLVMNIKNLVKNAVVDVAVNGEDAIDKATNKDYDVIFMDLRMPVLDGLTACSIIRKRDRKTPIYILTADVIKSTFEEALQVGATGVLPKPLKVERLKEVLASIVRKSVV